MHYLRILTAKKKFAVESFSCGAAKLDARVAFFALRHTPIMDMVASTYVVVPRENVRSVRLRDAVPSYLKICRKILSVPPLKEENV